MQNEPQIVERPVQGYIGTRAVMPMSAFAREIPAMTDKVSVWLKANGVLPTGQPFLRYHVIDMPERMDVELGIPVERAVSASGDLASNTLPAGRYAISSFKGVENGIPANKALIEWIAKQGEQIDHHTSDQGDVFASRYETFLTDATTEPDQHKWQTEIAIKLRA